MTEAMLTAFENSLEVIQTDVSSMITTALPIALAILGIFIAIRLGIKFFRSVAK